MLFRSLRLGKVCKKLKIPVPGRGYWANKSAGKPVATRPPLPSAAKGEHATETGRRLGPPRQGQKCSAPTCQAKKGETTLKPSGNAMKVVVYPRQSGDLRLSRAEQADSESVDELVEEGNVFEAVAVAGVEEADDQDTREVHTHEVPEDDVPDEYLDKD